MPYVKIDSGRLDRAIQMICDDYCHWPIVSLNQDVLDKHCEECPLNRIHNDEYWEKYGFDFTSYIYVDKEGDNG